MWACGVLRSSGVAALPVANCRPPSASAFEDFRPAASSCWRISAQSKVTGERWLLQQPGFSTTRIRQLGGGATQLSINAGNPVISGSQFDLGAFVGDDYKVRPNFSLSLELRYEARRTAGAGGVDGVAGLYNQNQVIVNVNIGVNQNFSLSVAPAYSPKAQPTGVWNCRRGLLSAAVGRKEDRCGQSTEHGGDQAEQS